MQKFLQYALAALLLVLPIGVLSAQSESNPHFAEYARYSSIVRITSNLAEENVGQGYLAEGDDGTIRVYVTRAMVNHPWELKVEIPNLPDGEAIVVEDKDFVCEHASPDVTRGACYFVLNEDDAELIQLGLLPLIPFVREHGVIEKGSFLLTPNEEYADWIRFQVLEVSETELVLVPVGPGGLLDEDGLYCSHSVGSPLMLVDENRPYVPAANKDGLPIIVGVAVNGEGKAIDQTSTLFGFETCYAKMVVSRVEEPK